MMNFISGNLNFDIEKIKGYTVVGIKKDKFENDVHGYVFTIEVNDSSYFYDNESDRDNDYQKLKKVRL